MGKLKTLMRGDTLGTMLIPMLTISIYSYLIGIPKLKTVRTYVTSSTLKLTRQTFPKHMSTSYLKFTMRHFQIYLSQKRMKTWNSQRSSSLIWLFKH